MARSVPLHGMAILAAVTSRAVTPARVVAFAAVVVALLGAGVVGIRVGQTMARNQFCCGLTGPRNGLLSLREFLGLTRFYSQVGQDRWVAETVFTGVRDGFFLDVGSADGTVDSNTRALEERGWTGVCVDPFPTNTAGRTCQLFKEVVYSTAGQRVRFRAAGGLGGIEERLGAWKDRATQSPSVEFVTVTLADILRRASAPRFIHYVSLDIEGAELDALRGFPFDAYSVGAWTIEHNLEEPKRGAIAQLLARHGYRRVHAWQQDDFYVNASTQPPGEARR